MMVWVLGRLGDKGHLALGGVPYRSFYSRRSHSDHGATHLKVVLETDEEGEADRLQNPLLVQRVFHLLQAHYL